MRILAPWKHNQINTFYVYEGEVLDWFGWVTADAWVEDGRRSEQQATDGMSVRYDMVRRVKAAVDAFLPNATIRVCLVPMVEVATRAIDCVPVFGVAGKGAAALVCRMELESLFGLAVAHLWK